MRLVGASACLQDVANGAATFAHRMVVRCDVGIKATAATHLKLATGANGGECTQRVVDGRHGHAWKAWFEAIVEFLSGGVRFITRHALDDGQSLRSQLQSRTA